MHIHQNLEQAVLPDYVKDTDGNKNDLNIMRCKLQDLLNELENYISLPTRSVPADS